VSLAPPNSCAAQVVVPHRLHTAVIGPKGRFIQQLQDECGGVQIHFPPSADAGPAAKGAAGKAPPSDTVRIRGPKADLDKAKRLLEELVAEKEASFEATIQAKPEFHKFLIGELCCVALCFLLLLFASRKRATQPLFIMVTIASKKTRIRLGDC
jgi:hypothetical protein